jgi:hypothetical protein
LSLSLAGDDEIVIRGSGRNGSHLDIERVGRAQSP